ncbi:ABC transporter permease [Desulfonatronum lacustre]|uniref:ABC transporter permease n=1 Tax=Desulfonatronum lacustre TaxID=66849 RepID=UPI0004B00ABA|nr:FtsX-like permease family protein [Desulfonatronum lacustre]
MTDIARNILGKADEENPVETETPLSTTLGLALREIRNRPKGFGIFLLCLVLGVGAVAGIGTLSAALDAGIRNNTRAILGGDLELRQAHAPIPDIAVEAFRAFGATSRVASLRAMARGPGGASTLTELKAVDEGYPLYGQARLRSGADLQAVLATREHEPEAEPMAVAEAGLLARIGAGVGDLIVVGDAAFRVVDVLEREPDKAAGFFGLGPRLMISLDDLEATGLVQPGSLIRYAVRLALPPEGDRTAAARTVRGELETAFPEASWQIREHGSAARGLTRAIENLSKYLNLVGLAALLIGGLGVAGSVQAYFEGRRTTLATMRCLGATSRTLFIFCLTQVLVMALLGGLAGLVLGVGLANLGAAALARGLGLQAVLGLYPKVLATALILGLCTTLAFVLRPLYLALRFRPAELFRGYVQPVPRPLRFRERAMIGVTWLVLAGLMAAAVDDGRTVLAFFSAALVSVVLFYGAARLAGWGAAKISGHWARHSPRWAGPLVRQAVANLHRPGAMTASVIFSLGLGLTMLVTVALVDGSFQDRLLRQLPRNAPDFFFVDIPRNRVEALRETARSWPELLEWKDQPSIRGRITAIGGLTPEEALRDPAVEWAIRGERGVSFAARPMEDVRIVGGAWWPEDYRGPARVCMDEGIARGLSAGLGDTLMMNILGREIQAEITCLREVDWESLALNHSIIFSPGILDGAPYTHIATVSLAPETPEERRAALLTALSEDFSRVVAVDVRDVLEDVARVTDQVGLGVRAIAAMTLLAGVVVLAGVVRAGLDRRRYEAAIFKVCGATRRDVVTTLGLEFLLLGGVAASLAAGLGTGLAWWFVRRVLDDPWTFLPGTLLTVLALGLLVVLGCGLAGMRSVLSARPWVLLRNE